MYNQFQKPSQPKILFVDRGQLYCKMGGNIAPEFTGASQQKFLKAEYGDNASTQHGVLHEAMLHDTAVAWIRDQEGQTRER